MYIPATSLLPRKYSGRGDKERRIQVNEKESSIPPHIKALANVFVNVKDAKRANFSF